MKKYILVLFVLPFLLVSCGEKEQEVAVTSVSLAQATAEMLIGETVQLTATVLPSNATDKTITWASSKQSVATVSNSGLVTALSEGTSTVTASCGGKSGTCRVTVSKGMVAVTSISLNKGELALIKGQSETLVATVNPSDATDKTVSWDSSDKDIVSVDANGTATAVSGGTATITAKAGNYQTTCIVTVSVPVESISLDYDNVSLEEEQSVSLAATVMPDDATDKTVTWSSSDTQVATVDENGKVIAIKEGSAIITAKAGDKTASCSISVKKKFIAVTSVSLNKTDISLIKGQFETLKANVSPSDASDKKVTWSSSNTGIATIDQNGKVTAIAGGSATIRAKAGDKQASCAVTVMVPATSITLNNNELILVKGQSDRLVATIQPYDATDKIVWSSSNTSVASVDANGTVVAVSNGSVSISATAGSIQASCKVIVVDPDVSTNAIFYTTSDGNEYYPYHTEGFGANLISSSYRNGRGVILFDGSVTSIGDNAFSSGKSLTSILIPNSVTSIGRYAFSYCTGLTSFVIPKSVVTIGELAFYNCSGLRSIGIPDTINCIEYGVFSGCSGLTSVQIPNSVNSIGKSAFGGCSGLTSVYIPNSVSSIGSFAFTNCTGLISIQIPNSVNSIEERTFSGCTSITSFHIPESVNSIGPYAFSNCTGLKSIKIPDTVNSIANNTFSGCTGLTSIEIPDSVTKILENAFSDCTGLTSIRIPNTVTILGESAFKGCTGLTSIEIPNSVIVIGWYAFKSCTGLKSVRITNTSGSIGRGAFSGCTGLTSIEIPRGTQIEESAFSGCTGITSIEIAVGCLVDEFAFSGCIGLKTIILPKSLSGIYSYAFKGCTGLTSITCLANTPYKIRTRAFDDTNNCPISVPAESVEAFKAADVWNEYADRIIAIQ
jgi:uncharacterized protein YjdB